MDMEQIGYFLFMQEQEEKQEQTLSFRSRNESCFLSEEEPRKTEKED